jgi:GTP-binding protein HflX
VGDAFSILLPDMSGFRMGRGNLKGVRFIHTHLGEEGIDREDTTDLRMLRLDLIGVLKADAQGNPRYLEIAYLDPQVKPLGCRIELLDLPQWQEIDFNTWIGERAGALQKILDSTQRVSGKTRAIVVVVSMGKRWETDSLLEEIVELAGACEVQIVGYVVQKLRRVHPAFLIGAGKLKELIMLSMERGADCIIFNRDLTPAQLNAISKMTELKVLDRTLLILDIFARHAHSREGKLQVELAQLKYMLPRLSGKYTAMSRLTGGIGGRGPGETKLEVNRRRVRDRIASLERELKHLKTGRELRRKKRTREGLPIISIVGYTNAGKSTLLNVLTHSHVTVEDKPFATLDTASRLLRFPRDRKVVITDTVGFIRDLPRDLLGAFMSTLDELRDADLLLHLVDISHPEFEQQIRVVEEILREIHLEEIPSLLVLNKIDKVPQEEFSRYARRHQAVGISAIHRETLCPLIEAIQKMVFPEQPTVVSNSTLIREFA